MFLLNFMVEWRQIARSFAFEFPKWIRNVVEKDATNEEKSWGLEWSSKWNQAAWNTRLGQQAECGANLFSVSVCLRQRHLLTAVYLFRWQELIINCFACWCQPCRRLSCQPSHLQPFLIWSESLLAARLPLRRSFLQKNWSCKHELVTSSDWQRAHHDDKSCGNFLTT